MAQEYSNYEDSHPKQNLLKRSPSKSPTRPHKSSRHSPAKTFTQRLQELDHASKNITINGYYPTGIELNAEGKSPISTLRYHFHHIETQHLTVSPEAQKNKDISI
jgi:hypothetical protein